MPDTGLISIRNEDGTQWLGSSGMWCSTRKGARPFNRSHFERLQREAPWARSRCSPDTGYFGLMNLTFHELTDEQVAAQISSADTFDEEMAEQDRAMEEELLHLYGAPPDA